MHNIDNTRNRFRRTNLEKKMVKAKPELHRYQDTSFFIVYVKTTAWVTRSQTFFRPYFFFAGIIRNEKIEI